jgi:orotate phosphoribosyltransferase
MPSASSRSRPAASAAAGQREAERARLADIIFERSFGRGRIVLASGRESDFYFDMKPTMLHPEGAALMARAILAEIAAARADYVGGLEMGAVPITGAVCQLSHERGTPVGGFFVRKEVKAHGARKRLEGFAKGETLTGKRIAVIEDVTTTGDSAMKAVEACREAGADVVLVITAVDREEGAAATFARAAIPFRALFTASEFLRR